MHAIAELSSKTVCIRTIFLQKKFITGMRIETQKIENEHQNFKQAKLHLTSKQAALSLTYWLVSLTDTIVVMSSNLTHICKSRVG